MEDIKDLINSFLEEANELISDLEDSLLTLEQMPTDKDAINRVFRVMHTLKGSGGMFGFNSVTNFTHHLESIYFKIRNEELELSEEILTLTLKSVDLIKDLLKSTGELPKSIQLNYDTLVNQIKSVSNISEDKKPITKDKPSLQKNNKEKSGSQYNTYYIHFEPNTEILQNGTNPLYLIDELIALGDSRVLLYTENIPEISKLQAENCYVSWEIILATKVEIGDIMDVFIFVEDDSHIDILNLSSYNLLQFPEFIESIDHFEKENLSLNIIKLQNLGKKLIEESLTEEHIKVQKKVKSETPSEPIQQKVQKEEIKKKKTKSEELNIIPPTSGFPLLILVSLSSMP